MTLALVAAGCGDDDDATTATAVTTGAGTDAPADTTVPADTAAPTTDSPADTATDTTEATEATAMTAAPSSTEATAGADAAAFCDAALDAEATAMAGPDVDFETATPEEIAAATVEYATELEPRLDAALAAAPADIASDVETLVGLVREGLEAGEDASSDPEYMAADEAIDVYVAESCGYETIEVSAVDYSFQNLPTTLAAGRTSFAFTNDGEEIHEMVLFRISDDTTESIEELLALPEEEAFSKAEFAGVTFSAQGGTDTETIELTPGRYGAVCFIPVGTTDMSALEGEEAPSGPPHFTAGMAAEFTVT
jgi:uncharacterized cupredoxin-like copper-binding protein